MEPADLRYPIGKYVPPAEITPAVIAEAISHIEQAPRRLREAVRGLDDAQLDTPYRDGGWTVRQVAHHLADSHMNAYVRFKLAITENEPAIKPYSESQWAQTADSLYGDASLSVSLVESLHARWTIFLKSLSPEQLKRTFRHPERGIISLESTLALYAWHGRHHVAHILSLRDRMGWK